MAGTIQIQTLRDRFLPPIPDSVAAPDAKASDSVLPPPLVSVASDSQFRFLSPVSVSGFTVSDLERDYNQSPHPLTTVPPLHPEAGLGLSLPVQFGPEAVRSSAGSLRPVPASGCFRHLRQGHQFRYNGPPWAGNRAGRRER